MEKFQSGDRNKDALDKAAYEETLRQAGSPEERAKIEKMEDQMEKLDGNSKEWPEK